MGKTIDMFKKFWADNIKTNMKKISIAMGVLINTVLLSVLGYAMDVAYTLQSRLAIMLIGIIFGIGAFSNVMIMYIFGKAKNGNGYDMPDNKYILDLIKHDNELKDIIKRKAEESLHNNNNVLNGD